MTFDGEPIASGQITFEPIGAGRIGIAQIVDGVYAMRAEQGPTAGDYVVRITAHRPSGRKVAPGARAVGQGATDVYEQFIPAKYNDQSELKIEVHSESEVAHDFALTST